MAKADEEIGKCTFNLNKGIQGKNLDVISKAYDGLGAALTKYVTASNTAAELKKKELGNVQMLYAAVKFSESLGQKRLKRIHG